MSETAIGIYRKSRDSGVFNTPKHRKMLIFRCLTANFKVVLSSCRSRGTNGIVSLPNSLVGIVCYIGGKNYGKDDSSTDGSKNGRDGCKA